MIHAPIYGSIINQPAKLYKRFTTEETITLEKKTKSTEHQQSRMIPPPETFEPVKGRISYENNYYHTHCNIRYVETSEKTEGQSQIIDGLVSKSFDMTIKFNGQYKPIAGSPYEPEIGDLLAIDNELWIIEEGILRKRNASLINFAVIYLPLRKVK